MKPISTIRAGLSDISGAIAEFPPDPGYCGDNPGVYSTHTIWCGENPNTLTDEAAYPLGDSPDFADEVSPSGSGAEFDPVFEIGADMDETLPVLGGKEGEEIRQSVMAHGMDALGWYVPFHHPGLQWGVYVPVSGMIYLLGEAFGTLRTPPATKVHLAFHAILNHELFHFAADYAIAQAELTHQEPWYVPAKRIFRSGKPDYCVKEEQLANAYMLSAFRSMKPALRVAGKQAAMKGFVATQPAGYRDALSVKPENWEPLLAELGHCFGRHAAKGSAHRSLWDPMRGYDWAAQFPIRPRVPWRFCPIHLVNDGARLGIPPEWLSFFLRVSDIQETDDFLRKLKTLASPIQRAWERTKQKLGVAITASADFKRWDRGSKDVFSVRVNDNFRAHLLRRKESDDWLAVAIGTHKEMGHG